MKGTGKEGKKRRSVALFTDSCQHSSHSLLFHALTSRIHSSYKALFVWVKGRREGSGRKRVRSFLCQPRSSATAANDLDGSISSRLPLLPSPRLPLPSRTDSPSPTLSLLRLSTSRSSRRAVPRSFVRLPKRFPSLPPNPIRLHRHPSSQLGLRKPSSDQVQAPSRRLPRLSKHIIQRSFLTSSTAPSLRPVS
jgi:hypothetical protein